MFFEACDIRSTSVALCSSVLSLISSFTGYIWPKSFSQSVLLMDNTSSMYLYRKLNQDADFFPLRAETVYILLRMNIKNCRLEEGRNLNQLEWQLSAEKPFRKTTKMLSTRNSNSLMISSSMYLVFESERSVIRYASPLS